MASKLNKRDQLLQETEKKTGLTLIRIQTEGQLNQMLAGGLAELYQSVFGGPPYNEKFTREEVCDIFSSFLKEGGQIFTASEPGSATPVAFVVSVPLAVDFNVAAAVKDRVIVEKTAYFSEDGVAESYRRRGISDSMKKLLLNTCGFDGFDRVLLRTSIENYRQISAVNKAGGRVVKGLIQDVPRLRNDGSTTIDKNSFYLFMTAKRVLTPDVFNRVVVTRDAAGDKAVVLDDVARRKQKKIAEKISQVYPNVKSVDFSKQAPQGNVVFDGKLYCMKPSANRKI